ncbi:hypothetical protein [Paracoccus sp. (in: a-proteobacteria)]|uniref:hypothetical protein n=1 Tax=Paracoccus sp. TaxID=267 RepID=UPI0026E10D54|nr:hypothetical protein [Paracoccus sp. (in: a-proteobacteria)]MDO5647767.1 hypothetical protein [Paracoccus sp. (in: a-proteobacteria)]
MTASTARRSDRLTRVGKVHFLVYSNGAEPFAQNADDYCQSALRVGFDTATHVTEQDLRATPFWDENRAILEQPRGAGYWLWKPWIVLQKLREVGPDDVVIYNDAGRYKPGSFHQFPAFPHAAVELCALTPRRFIHGFVTNWTVQENLTKRDCFTLMDADTPDMRKALQIGACPLIYMPSPDSFAFLERWVELARDPRLLTDQPDETGAPFPEFQDHRHDQSIASILAHQTGAHYLDLTRAGAGAICDDITRRNPDVPRLQTHIGWVSLIMSRALPDDFFVQDPPNLRLASHLVRNLTPDEPLPNASGIQPKGQLVAQFDALRQAGAGGVTRQHLEAALDGCKPVAAWMHLLSREDEAEAFWQAFRDQANSGTESDGEDPRRAAVAALHRTRAAMPDLSRRVTALWIWGLLGDQARATFKSAHNTVKNPAGLAAMMRFADVLTAEGIPSIQHDLAPDTAMLSANVSDRLIRWLIA